MFLILCLEMKFWLSLHIKWKTVYTVGLRPKGSTIKFSRVKIIKLSKGTALGRQEMRNTKNKLLRQRKEHIKDGSHPSASGPGGG
jgi:hypothetical protein